MEIKTVLLYDFFRSYITKEKIQYLYDVEEINIIECFEKLFDEDPIFAKRLVRSFNIITISDIDEKRLIELRMKVISQITREEFTE